MSIAPTTTKDLTTTSTELATTSTAVMRAGQAHSNDLMQELATVVATTASRERLRKRTLLVLLVVGVVVIAAAAVSGKTLAGNLPLGLFGVLCLAPVLPLSIGWGVRNRALLDAAAKDAAVDGIALASAVKLVQQGVGPSTALRASLKAPAR